MSIYPDVKVEGSSLAIIKPSQFSPTSSITVFKDIYSV
jgi:hypothetical protein